MAAEGVIVWLREPFETDVIQRLNAQSGKFSVQRRCADLTETRACVRAGLGSIVVADGDGFGLDASVIDEFHQAGYFVLLVVDDPIDAPSLGEDARCDRSSADFVVDSLTMGVRNRMLGGDAPILPAREETKREPMKYDGRLIVVWGTSGAPGRSTIALNLADLMARCGREVTLVDADAHAPSLAHLLGFESPESGLAVASMLRNQGDLTQERLDNQRLRIADQFALLSGLTRADRWHNLQPETVYEVLRQLQNLGDVVVDLSDGIADDDPSQLTFVPTPQDLNRNILEAADTLLIVARGDTIGLTRLAHVLKECEEHSLTPNAVVINRARPSTTGGAVERTIDTVLASIAPDFPRVIIEDSTEVDAATLAGTTVLEGAPESKFSAQIEHLAQMLDLVPNVETRSGRRARKHGKAQKTRRASKAPQSNTATTAESSTQKTRSKWSPKNFLGRRGAGK